VRHQSGTLPTDKTYTGQRSHTDDFGLHFYNARWYDSSLGRFASADSIIQAPFHPSSYDRFAYVWNNAVNAVDPSGHFCAQVGENTVCSADHDSYPYWNPGYTWLDYDDLSTEKGGITGVSATDVYNYYIEMWSMKDEWWWDVFGSDGFSIWDFLSVMSYREVFPAVNLANELAEAGVRFYYSWSATKKREADNPATLLDWWARFSESTSRLIKSNRTPGLDPQHKNSIHSMEKVGNSFHKPPTAWKQGWAFDRPFNWGNAYILTVDTAQMYHNNLHAMFGTVPGVTPAERFFIPSGCAWFNWQEKTNYGATCPRVP
jgi:RHS repeat-associated protein